VIQTLDTASPTYYGERMRSAVIVAFVALLASGCASTGEDGVSFQFISGTLSTELAAGVPEAEAATRAALAELNLVGIDGVVDGLRARINARMATGTKVRVNLRALDFDTSSVSIKVGTIGDRTLSMQILRHIERELERTDA
jgi:hypothetical protein